MQKQSSVRSITKDKALYLKFIRCTSKVQYESESHAMRHIPNSQITYECNICNKWHRGTKAEWAILNRIRIIQKIRERSALMRRKARLKKEQDIIVHHDITVDDISIQPIAKEQKPIHPFAKEFARTCCVRTKEKTIAQCIMSQVRRNIARWYCENYSGETDKDLADFYSQHRFKIWEKLMENMEVENLPKEMGEYMAKRYPYEIREDGIFKGHGLLICHSLEELYNAWKYRIREKEEYLKKYKDVEVKNTTLQEKLAKILV